MAAITAQLKLEIKQFKSAIKTVKTATTGMSRNAARSGKSLAKGLFGGLASAARRAVSGATTALRKLGSGLGLAIGFQLANSLGGAVKKSMGGILSEGMQMEGLVMAFNALSADGNGGLRVFREMEKQALKTGVAIDSQSGSLRKLMAMGLDENKALALNRSFLDIGGAIGATTQEIGLIGTAVAQVYSKQTAQMEELRGQLGERGVPIMAALQKSLGMESPDELFKAIKAGAVTGDQVVDVFLKMAGPFDKLRGGADRGALTLSGMFARLSQEAKAFKRIIGAELIPVLKPHIQAALDRMKALRETTRDIVHLIKDGFADLGKAGMLDLLRDGLTLAFQYALNQLVKGLFGVASALGTYIGEAFKNSLTIFQILTRADFWKGMKDGLEWAARGFGNVMYEVLANLMESLSGLRVIGKDFAEAGANIRQNKRDSLSTQADQEKSIRDLLVNRIGETSRNVVDSFKDGVANAPEVFENLEELLADLEQRLANIKRTERERLTPAPAVKNAPGAGKPGDSPEVATVSPPEKLAAAGIVASSMARIGGGGRVAGLDTQTKIAQNQLDTQKNILKLIDANARKTYPGGAVLV
jgi:tape measure domain-containing protein